MSTPSESGPLGDEIPPAIPAPANPTEGIEPANDPVITPVTQVTETETGTVVVGYPSSSNTEFDVVPVVGSETDYDPRADS